MPKLIALKPLLGDYGKVMPGHVFHVDDERAAIDLEARGLAARCPEGVFSKMLGCAPENKALTVNHSGDAPPIVTTLPERPTSAEPPRVHHETGRRRARN